MRAAPFLLTFAILAIGMVLAFLQATGSSDEPVQLASRPTVTPRPRPTSPSQLVEVAPTRPQGASFAESGAAAPPVAIAQQPSATATTSATATPSPVPPTQPPTHGPTAEPATSTPPASAPTAAAYLRVGNTDGQGVFLRRTPRMDDKVRAWLDGTPMEVVGEPVTGEGHTWQHVRAPDGTEGYVPAEYLVGGG